MHTTNDGLTECAGCDYRIDHEEMKDRIKELEEKINNIVMICEHYAINHNSYSARRSFLGMVKFDVASSKHSNKKARDVLNELLEGE